MRRPQLATSAEVNSCIVAQLGSVGPDTMGAECVAELERGDTILSVFLVGRS